MLAVVLLTRQLSAVTVASKDHDELATVKTRERMRREPDDHDDGSRDHQPDD